MKNRGVPARLHEVALSAKAAQDAVDKILGVNETPAIRDLRVEDVEGVGSVSIRNALDGIAPELARSYDQIVQDIRDRSRQSWAGTSHEIREILAAMLRNLAPDEAVVQQKWYAREPMTSGPTQSQRVRYILEQRHAGSKEHDVLAEVSLLEERIGRLVRATYARASDAAHRFKGRREAIKILRYLEVFARDLLDLD